MLLKYITRIVFVKFKLISHTYFFLSEELRGEKSRGKTYRTTTKVITYVWKHTFAKLGEDWVFLGVLGIVMAIIRCVIYPTFWI